MTIHHDLTTQRATTEEKGLTAYVEYEVVDGKLNILHTIVPPPLEGQGIASQLVKFVYDYAITKGLMPQATCSYARTWLARHPDYAK